MDLLDSAELIQYLGSKGFLPGVQTAAPKPPGEEKGLKNDIGENNCFLNVVIQCLWHLDSFRNKFQMKGEHVHNEHCVFCSLQNIFFQYAYSAETILPPTVLRETMAVLYQKDSKFQLNEMDDAGEVYEAINRMLHSNLASQKQNEDKQWARLKNKECTDRECVSHSVFAIRTRDKIVCQKCKYVERQPDDCVFAAYCYPTLLRALKEQHPTWSFADMLKSGSQDFRSCRKPDESCGGDCAEVVHELVMAPQVFTINIAWDNSQADVDSIRSFMDTIDREMDVMSLFSNGPKDFKIGKYALRAFIAYYGKHYIAFCKGRHNGETWYYFDDTMVKTVGTEWADVREKCMKGRFQPSVLFYEGPGHDQLLIESLLLPQNSQIASKVTLQSVAPVHNPSKVEIQEPVKVVVQEPVNVEVPEPTKIVPLVVSEPKIEVPQPVVTPVTKVDISADKSQIAVSTIMSGDTSFYFMNPSLDKPFDDFIAERTNWIYKRQTRLYRLAADKFFRMDPHTQDLKDTFEYIDVCQIYITDNKNLILKFYSGKERQYLTLAQVDPFVAALMKRAGREITVDDKRTPEQLAQMTQSIPSLESQMHV